MESSNNQQAVLPISIVIPTYFEEKLLPRLLESINNQIMQPCEVIVSDGFSTDRTREIALQYGAKVIDGGKVAVGRNNGGIVAQGELIMFLDADTVLPHSHTLMDVYVQYIKKNVDIASVYFKADNKWGFRTPEMAPHLVFWVVNTLKSLQSAVGRAMFVELGVFILVKKHIFDEVGGFDPEYWVGEDRRFITAAINKGYKYKVLRSYVVTSGRRFQNFRSVGRLVFGNMGATMLGLFGHSPKSRLRQRFWKMYGELGGKQQKEE